MTRIMRKIIKLIEVNKIEDNTHEKMKNDNKNNNINNNKMMEKKEKNNITMIQVMIRRR